MAIWIKRLALGVGALVLLLIVAALVLVATFDANQYKSLAIDWMKTERQRTLAIDGPVDLSVFPRLAVKVSKVRLSERGRPEEFAAVDQAALSLQWLPLLRKQLVVDSISARGVRARIVRDARGASNVDDLLGPKKDAAPAGTPAARSAVQFAVGELHVDEASLTLRDEQSGVTGTATLDSFRSGRLANGEPTPVQFQTTLALEKPQALRLTFDGRTLLTFDTASGSASLRNADLKIGGDTDTVKSLHATLSGSLAWDGSTLAAAPIDVALTDAKTSGVVLGASSLKAQRLVYSTATKKLELEAMHLALSGKQAGNPFEAQVDWPQLAIAGDKIKGSGISGRVKLEGKTALTGRLESGAPDGDFDALRLPGLVLKLDGTSGARKVDAQLKANALFNPAKTAVALERLDLRAAITEPGLQPLALTVGGSAGGDLRSAQWTLQGALNSNKFDTTGSASFASAVPTLQVAARFDRLDINQLTAPSAGAAASAAAPNGPAETPIGLEGLSALNGRFTLSAGRLVLRQYEVADAKLDATLDAGTLRVTRLAGQAWGGRIDGSGSADAKGKRIAVKLVAEGIDAHELLREVAGKDLLEGTGRVSADLVTSGTTLGALRTNLGGATALHLRDGAIKGLNLARALRQAKAAIGLKQDALSKASVTEKTDFSELTASARLENGIARSDDLDVKSPYLRIGGAGRFDIGAGRIDYTARATVANNPTGQDGAELAALRGVTVPVRLSGPFEAIDWQIQWSGVAAAAVENKLKDKLAEKLGLSKPAEPAPAASAAAEAPRQRVEDKLKDKLRGLLSK